MSTPQFGIWNDARSPGAWREFDRIEVAAAAARIAGVVERTPLVRFDLGDDGIELRLKLENRQLTGAFKARGAWNQIAQLSAEERARGVVCASSGNHGGSLAWAAARAGVRATIVMPANAYPNKIAACRERGAEVVLAPDRESAERECAQRTAAGAVLVHPYDAERTIQGAGTVGAEIAEDWPELDAVLVPVGGGGLVSGIAIGVRQTLARSRGPAAADAAVVVGVEPQGAPGLTRGLQSGAPQQLTDIRSQVQGLTPLATGRVNVAVCSAALDGTLLLADEEIFAAQARLVRELGEIVEPAGAAAFAAALLLSPAAGALPLLAERLTRGRRGDTLRVCAVVSGGNPDPDQLAALSRAS